MKKYIGATIRIGREIWCLLYAGFFIIDTIVLINHYFLSYGQCYHDIWTMEFI